MLKFSRLLPGFKGASSQDPDLFRWPEGRRFNEYPFSYIVDEASAVHFASVEHTKIPNFLQNDDWWDARLGIGTNGGCFTLHTLSRPAERHFPKAPLGWKNLSSIPSDLKNNHF